MNSDDTMRRFVNHLQSVDRRSVFDPAHGTVIVFGENTDRNAQFAINEQTLNARLAGTRRILRWRELTPIQS